MYRKYRLKFQGKVYVPTSEDRGNFQSNTVTFAIMADDMESAIAAGRKAIECMVGPDRPRLPRMHEWYSLVSIREVKG